MDFGSVEILNGKKGSLLFQIALLWSQYFGQNFLLWSHHSTFQIRKHEVFELSLENCWIPSNTVVLTTACFWIVKNFLESKSNKKGVFWFMLIGASCGPSVKTEPVRQQAFLEIALLWVNHIHFSAIVNWSNRHQIFYLCKYFIVEETHTETSCRKLSQET